MHKVEHSLWHRMGKLIRGEAKNQPPPPLHYAFSQSKPLNLILDEYNSDGNLIYMRALSSSSLVKNARRISKR